MGGPYSSGCATCRQRKIKCDEGKPRCQRCGRSGLSCLGYPQRPLRFQVISDSSQKWSRPEASKQVSNWPKLSGSQKRKAVEFKIFDHDTHDSTMCDRQSNACDIIYQPLTTDILRILELDTLGGRQYERYGPPREGLGNRAVIIHPRPAPFASWISFIPSHLGHNHALDSAVDSVVSAFNALVLQEIEKLRHARKKYMKALLILQNVLNGSDALSAETLCAIMVLSLFEAIMSEDAQKAWIQHAGGSSRLISCRGPSRFNTDFECAMFHAQVAPMIIKAHLESEPCFLEAEPWQDLMVRCHQRSMDYRLSIESEYSWPGRLELMQLITHLPRIQRDLTNFLASSEAITCTVADLLRVRLCSQRSCLHDWFIARSKEPPFKTKSATNSGTLEPLYTARYLGRSWSLPARHGHRWCNFIAYIQYIIMGVLSLELSPLLADECVFLGNEYLRMLEYIKLWAPAKAISASAGLRPSQVALSTAQEWSRNESYTIEHSSSVALLRRKISFQKWQNYLVAAGAKA